TVSASAQAPAPSPGEDPGVPQVTGTGAKKAPEPADEENDGWFDVSSFLDKKYGFLPIVMPVTEPAVGYGAKGGLMFLSKSFGDIYAGLGRPNIAFVGGMGTSNGTWGAFVGDVRYWLDDHL